MDASTNALNLNLYQPVIGAQIIDLIMETFNSSKFFKVYSLNRFISIGKISFLIANNDVFVMSPDVMETVILYVHNNKMIKFYD